MTQGVGSGGGFTIHPAIASLVAALARNQARVNEALDTLHHRSNSTWIHYYRAAASLNRWCVRARLMAANYAADQITPKRKKPKSTRPALKVDEVEKLLDGDRPCVKVRPEVAKTRVGAEQPLPCDLADLLLSVRPDDVAGDAPVFPTIPKDSTFRRDCVAAGINHKPDHLGRKIDRHGLRVTFSTWVGMTSASDREQSLLTPRTAGRDAPVEHGFSPTRPIVPRRRVAVIAGIKAGTKFWQR